MSNLFHSLYHEATKDPEAALQRITELKVELNNNLARELAQVRMVEKKLQQSHPPEVEADLKTHLSELQRIHQGSKQLKDGLEDMEGLIQRNKLRLKAEGAMEEFAAFAEPDNPELTAVSSVGATHDEMLQRLLQQTAQKEARAEIALSGLPEESGQSAGEQVDTEQAARSRAEEMVQQMKTMMGLSDDGGQDSREAGSDQTGSVESE